MTRCFNGHTTDRPGCPGCHHAFHVVRQGRVEGGRLLPPVVNGPEECNLCHEARHTRPVAGCRRCEGAFAETLALAQEAAAPVRNRILELKMAGWMLGWQATLAGWVTILAGGAWGNWFQRPDGSNDFVKQAFVIFGIPAVQWVIRREVRRRERMLPRLDPTGQIVYGDDDRP